MFVFYNYERPSMGPTGLKLATTNDRLCREPFFDTMYEKETRLTERENDNVQIIFSEF